MTMAAAPNLYHDLCKEIDMLEIRIRDLEMEYKWWLKACHGTGRNAVPLDICLKRMEEICDQVEMYSTLLETKEKTREEIEKRMSELEGLEGKVMYMREVEGKTLAEIAADLGYSYIWIKKISARAKKKYTKSIPRC